MPTRISSDAVKAATGKSWSAWMTALARAKRERWSHRHIVAHLRHKFGLSPWWCQMVTVGFERENGLRSEGRTATAGYETGVQRTFAVSADKAWNLVTSPAGLDLWLKPLSGFSLSRMSKFKTRDHAEGMVRVLRSRNHLRLSWQPRSWKKASTIQLRVVPTGTSKTSIRFHQESIPSGHDRERMRARWKEALVNLKELV